MLSYIFHIKRRFILPQSNYSTLFFFPFSQLTNMNWGVTQIHSESTLYLEFTECENSPPVSAVYVGNCWKKSSCMYLWELPGLEMGLIPWSTHWLCRALSIPFKTPGGILGESLEPDSTCMGEQTKLAYHKNPASWLLLDYNLWLIKQTVNNQCHAYWSFYINFFKQQTCVPKPNPSLSFGWEQSHITPGTPVE